MCLPCVHLKIVQFQDFQTIRFVENKKNVHDALKKFVPTQENQAVTPALDDTRHF